jgi:signal transduction histidine kinase
MPDTPAELVGLTSSSPTERARAVSWLVQHPLAIETPALMRAMQTEMVPRIRAQLVQVLQARQRAARSPTTESSDAGPSPLPTGGELVSLIRHELTPAVGWIRLAADDELPDFQSSKTNAAIKKLQRRIDGLVAMLKADEDLTLTGVSLPQALADNWPDAKSEPSVRPTSEEASIEIETDESLFALMLSNVFQNAIDASIEAVGEPRVAVSWGYTAESYWVRIANPFVGGHLRLAHVADVGASSKGAHEGRGLDLIATVAQRLDIAINLEGHSGTASFTLSGVRPNA